MVSMYVCIDYNGCISFIWKLNLDRENNPRDYNFRKLTVNLSAKIQ